MIISMNKTGLNLNLVQSIHKQLHNMVKFTYQKNTSIKNIHAQNKIELEFDPFQKPQIIAQHGEIHFTGDYLNEKRLLFMHRTGLNLILVNSKSHKHLHNMVKFKKQFHNMVKFKNDCRT